MRIGSTDRRASQQRSTARTISFTSAGSNDPLRLRTCIWGELTRTGNDTTDCAALTRTGVAMNAFSAKDTREGDEMEEAERHQIIANLPSEARSIFTPGLAWLLAGLRTYRPCRSKMTGVSTDPSSRF